MCQALERVRASEPNMAAGNNSQQQGSRAEQVRPLYCSYARHSAMCGGHLAPLVNSLDILAHAVNGVREAKGLGLRYM